LFNELFFGADEQCQSSLDDFNLFDEMLLWIIMHQICLNTSLSYNKNQRPPAETRLDLGMNVTFSD